MEICLKVLKYEMLDVCWKPCRKWTMKIWRTRWWLLAEWVCPDGRKLSAALDWWEKCQRLFTCLFNNFLYFDAWNTAGNIAGIHWEMRKSTPKINIQIHWHWFAHFVFASHPPLLATCNNLPWFAVLLTRTPMTRKIFRAAWWMMDLPMIRKTMHQGTGAFGCRSVMSFQCVIQGCCRWRHTLLMLQKSIEIPKPTT